MLINNILFQKTSVTSKTRESAVSKFRILIQRVLINLCNGHSYRKHGLNNYKDANAVISCRSEKDRQKDFAAV
jgi:hypothetical protein